MRESHTFNLKYLWINLSALFCGYMIIPFMSPYLKSIGFDSVEIGVLIALFPLTIFLVSPIIGTISDDIGRKKVIVAGVFIQIIGLMLTLLVKSFGLQ